MTYLELTLRYFDGKYFAKQVEKKKKKSEEEFFEDEKEVDFLLVFELIC